MKRKYFWPLAGILTIAVVSLTACGNGDQTAAGFERPPAPVTVLAAVQQDVPVYIDAVGTTVAREMVSIVPQVSGRITQIHFADGANVKKGTPLFTIDPRPYQAALNSAQANAVEKQAILEHARIEFTRVENLIQTRAISQEDFDRRKNAVRIAEAHLTQSRAEIETARINLEYCFIRSPIEGRAGQRLVDLGNIVTPTETKSLLTIQRLNPIYADFTVTENELTAVQANMRRGSLKAEVRLPDDNRSVRGGELTFLDNAVQDGTGTVKLRATIPNQDHLFWPGRFVRVRLVLDTRKNAVLVPAAAPQNSAKGTFVYVVKADSTAELRPVVLGQTQGDLIVINEGVNAGENIVVSGQLGVTPGGKVKIHQSPQSFAGSSGGAVEKS